MINLETVKTLRALRLPGMARELESQLEDPQRYKDLSFEDRIALMVDAEGLSRRQNTITRRIREAESYDLLEILEVCNKKGAMIFCTQYDTDEWYYRIDCDRPEGDDSGVAEAILDRIIHNKYAINVKGRISMRKRHAFAGSEESEVSING